MKKIALLLTASILVLIFSCQEKTKPVVNDAYIAFYNVENLFDTINNPDKIDEEFLPDGKKKWNQERYNKKINDISKVIASLTKAELPFLVGLCEVENKAVIEDLAATEHLKAANYKVVHEESPDVRGIDVGLMYSPSSFKYVSHNTFTISFDDQPDFYTRDILYVKGVAFDVDTLHVFVNHWSSRRGGEEASAYKRIKAAEIVRAQVDKLFATNPDAKIVIMGDMNDYPDNKSIYEVLNAKNNKDSQDKTELYNLVYDKNANGEGTHNYKCHWGVLDNMIISRSLLSGTSPLQVDANSIHFFKEDWVMYNNKSCGELTPSRTYGGPNYYGGYSDHLAVFFKLQYTK